MTPETKARITIDKNLELAGYMVQDLKDMNLSISRGVAVREYPTDMGPVDYVLFVDGKPVGVVEAKRTEMGQDMTIVESQSGGYARANLKWVKNEPLRFVYETTDVVTYFTDLKDEKYSISIDLNN